MCGADDRHARVLAEVVRRYRLAEHRARHPDGSPDARARHPAHLHARHRFPPVPVPGACRPAQRRAVSRGSPRRHPSQQSGIDGPDRLSASICDRRGLRGIRPRVAGRTGSSVRGANIGGSSMFSSPLRKRSVARPGACGLTAGVEPGHPEHLLLLVYGWFLRSADGPPIWVPILGIASPNCGRIARMPGCETTQLPCRRAFVASGRGGLRFATRAIGAIRS